MPPLTYIHAFEAARTTAGGGAVSGAENAPPTAGGKGLKTDENGARVAGDQKARLCPDTGRRRAFSCMLFPDGKRDKSL